MAQGVSRCHFVTVIVFFCTPAYKGCNTRNLQLKAAHQLCGGIMSNTDSNQRNDQVDRTETAKPIVVAYDPWEMRFRDEKRRVGTAG